jgi:hypothetical protein
MFESSHRRTARPLSVVVAGSVVLAAGCANEAPVPPPPFRPATTTIELMESVIAHSAEIYWEAVQVTVDEEGVHERQPQTDEEWEFVWAAALAIAESGNLLMMPPRAVDNGAWMQFSRSLVEAGIEAAAAAEAHDMDRVFAAGEQVYNVCLGCHTRYVPELQRVSGE